MMNREAILEKLENYGGRIQENRYISSVSNGLSAILPIIMIGAIGSLINGINVGSYQKFLVSSGLKAYTSIPGSITTDFIALYAVFAIALKLAESYKKDGVTAGVLAIMSFLIITPLGNTKEIGNYLPTSWLGAMGLFVAIFTGIGISRLYAYIVEKNFIIKMPDGVPPTIAKSFAALIPGFIIVAIMIAIKALFLATAYGNLHAFVFKIVQMPMQSLSNSWGAMVAGTLAMQGLWFLGIHGTMAIGVSILKPVWFALDLENLKQFEAGLRGQNILGWSYYFGYLAIGGAGSTLGLAFLMLRSKSLRYSTLGKLAIVPGLCGINEPIIFGIPLVMNPMMAIPFLFCSVLIGTLAYVFISIGILPTSTGITVPLGTPVILSGLMVAGWQGAVFQVFATMVSAAFYLPFFKKIDQQAFEEEHSETENVA